MTEDRLDDLERLASRYVDGELDAAERVEVERRLGDDDALHAAVDALQGTRSVLATDLAGRGFTASAGFADRVLNDIRRLPTPAEVAGGGGFETQLTVWSRRIVFAAAAVVLAVVAVWAGAERTSQGDDQLIADQDIRRAIEQMDAEIEADERDGGEAEATRRPR